MIGYSRIYKSIAYNNFFFNDTATTEIYTLSLHDALPICFESKPGVGKFSWLAPSGQKGKEYDLTFTVQEAETNEKYKVEVTTKLVVVSNTGPIIRNLEVDGYNKEVVIKYQLESEKPVTRSEERRVGKECRSRWSLYH